MATILAGFFCMIVGFNSYPLIETNGGKAFGAGEDRAEANSPEKTKASEKTEEGLQNQTVIITPEGSGYNSWPFIRTLRNRLVCVYSRGVVHSVDERVRGTFARVSEDGGKTWLPETTVINTPNSGETSEGSGLDAKGNMLLFVRIASPKLKHDLYRSEDGVHFIKIASLDLNPAPMQVMDIVQLRNGDLMTFWFAGSYRNTQNGAWGTLISRDNGLSWQQQTIESGLSKENWPTEHSAIVHPDGRILVVARAESSGGEIAQFQIESEDNGTTWKKYRTNITNIRESTPALLYDRENGLISNYYYQRGEGILWRRVAAFDDIWHNAQKWPDSELVIKASANGCHAGNVKGTLFGNKHALALYSGNETQTAIVTLVVSSPK